MKAETIWSYEAGVKGRVAQRRVGFDLSAFYYDYTNFQTLSLDPTQGTVNAGKASAYGVEANLDWRVTKQVSLFAGYNYLHAQYDQFVEKLGGVLTDLSGNQMRLAPRHPFSIGGDITQPVSDLAGSASARHLCASLGLFLHQRQSADRAAGRIRAAQHAARHRREGRRLGRGDLRLEPHRRQVDPRRRQQRQVVRRADRDPRRSALLRRAPPTSPLTPASITKDRSTNLLLKSLALMPACFLIAAADPADQLKINQIQVVGTHNSYHQPVDPRVLDWGAPKVTAAIEAILQDPAACDAQDAGGGEFRQSRRAPTSARRWNITNRRSPLSSLPASAASSSTCTMIRRAVSIATPAPIRCCAPRA